MRSVPNYTCVKLTIKELAEHSFSINYTPEELTDKNCLVKQTDSLLLDQIERLRGCKVSHIEELILVEARKSKNTEAPLKYVLEHGFLFQGRHYSRFGKSASQGKDGITAFVIDNIFEELYRITQLDLNPSRCVISKYEAQRCLAFSACTLVYDYMPRIMIIDEYQKTLPRQFIKYVTEVKRDYTNKETGEQGTYTAREIREGYQDIAISPFDGCGCHEEEFMKEVSAASGLDYDAAGFQIRLPFMKGFSVYVPFREMLREWGVEQLTDVYGNTHSIEEIDCIWNVTMFKGHKMFLNCYGQNAWLKYMESLTRYRYKLGISKYSHHLKNINKMARMNFQYLQCLNLMNPVYVRWFENKTKPPYDILSPENAGPIIQAARYTTSLFEKIIKGSKFHTYKFMGVGNTSDYRAESFYMKAVLLNDDMLLDPAVRQYLYRKLKKAIQEARLGKIYADGFYHTVVGDMVGYLQFAAGLGPVGCLKAGEFYAGTMPEGKILSFRSPLVDPSEVNDISLVSNTDTRRWFPHFTNQDVVMINMYDLSMPRQGGMDADGDAVFLCSEPFIVNAKINKPVIIDIQDKLTAREKEYTARNLIEYEMMTRDSRIGEITNVATSIENKYTTEPGIKKYYEDCTSLLRIYQGKEIDYLKTGFRWQMNSGLRKHSQKLPWFLLYNYPSKLKTYESLREKNLKKEKAEDRLELNAYRSPSPMNELCDYIGAWEKRHLLWGTHGSAVKDTRSLILDQSLVLEDKKTMTRIRHLINEHSEKLKALLDARRESSSEGSYGELDLLLEAYSKKLEAVLPGQPDLLANYVIKVSYSNLSVSKGLAWSLFGSCILENIRRNSPLQPAMEIFETGPDTENAYEYLGKYYIMEPKTETCSKAG